MAHRLRCWRSSACGEVSRSASRRGAGCDPHQRRPQENGEQPCRLAVERHCHVLRLGLLGLWRRFSCRRSVSLFPGCSLSWLSALLDVDSPRVCEQPGAACGWPSQVPRRIVWSRLGTSFRTLMGGLPCSLLSCSTRASSSTAAGFVVVPGTFAVVGRSDSRWSGAPCPWDWSLTPGQNGSSKQQLDQLRRQLHVPRRVHLLSFDHVVRSCGSDLGLLIFTVVTSAERG